MSPPRFTTSMRVVNLAPKDVCEGCSRPTPGRTGFCSSCLDRMEREDEREREIESFIDSH